MNETLQPVIERTDESLVRTIAEWLKLEGLVWASPWMIHDHGAFIPHLDEGSADRERVMLAMPEYNFGFNHLNSWYSVILITPNFDPSDNIQAATAQAPTLGRAFCEAVVWWIEAQEDVL